MDTNAKGGLSEVVWEAKVIRGPNSEYGPPGQVEDLGEIAHYYKNPVKRLVKKLKRK